MPLEHSAHSPAIGLVQRRGVSGVLNASDDITCWIIISILLNVDSLRLETVLTRLV